MRQVPFSLVERGCSSRISAWASLFMKSSCPVLLKRMMPVAACCCVLCTTLRPLSGLDISPCVAIAMSPPIFVAAQGQRSENTSIIQPEKLATFCTSSWCGSVLHLSNRRARGCRFCAGLVKNQETSWLERSLAISLRWFVVQDNAAIGRFLWV